MHLVEQITLLVISRSQDSPALPAHLSFSSTRPSTPNLDLSELRHLAHIEMGPPCVLDLALISTRANGDGQRRQIKSIHTCGEGGAGTSRCPLEVSEVPERALGKALPGITLSETQPHPPLSLPPSRRLPGDRRVMRHGTKQGQCWRVLSALGMLGCRCVPVRV